MSIELGLSVAPVFARHPEQLKRFRVVACSLLTPFFFLKGGLSVDLGALVTALPLLLGFLAVKVALKFAGVMPVALHYLRPHATFTTLLMSTGLTFGTIAQRLFSPPVDVFTEQEVVAVEDAEFEPSRSERIGLPR